MVKRICMLLFLVLVTHGYAQESAYAEIQKLYENFEYDKVIEVSTEFLTRPEIQDSIKIDIYLMRAVSFFAKGNPEQTANSFQNILSIRKDFSPTTQILNPTLLRMFNNMKLEHLKKLTDAEAKKDSVASVSQIIYNKQISFGSAFVKNMILPGWGQLSLGKERGFFYGLAYIANVGALIYYAADASEKRDAYQREVNDQKFDQLYSDYNKSYKMKNNLFITYAIILLYSQLDLLLFHNEEQIEVSPNKISIQPWHSLSGDYNISVHIPL